MKLEFTVAGPPKPWQRAASRNGKRFTPKAMREYQKTVGMAGARRALSDLSTGQVWPMGARYSMALVVTPKTAVRADLDNYAKTVMDALTGVLWNDDSQVDCILVSREAPSKDGCGIHVAVRAL